MRSILSGVFALVSVLSTLACGGVGGTSGVSGYYNSGGCSQYGETCVGEAPTDGAFELGVFPFDGEDVTSITMVMTYVDLVDGEDVTETLDVYQSYPGEFWVWSPSAPPEGYVEVTATAVYYDGLEESLFCSQDPAADWAAFKGEWEVEADDRYSSSDGCYVRVNLREMVED